MSSLAARLALVLHRAVFALLPWGVFSLLLVPVPFADRAGVSPSGPARAEASPYEGFGASTPGGSEGEVVRVTNLNDSGPGSFREAVSQGNRTVVFDVGGTIALGSAVFVTGAFLTIDGFTAPPPGITLHGEALVIRGNQGAHDVIVRGIRMRGARRDGIQIAFDAYNVVIDHVSIHGSGDGNLDITEAAHDVTVSWSILAAPTSDRNMLIKYGARRISLHHNLFVDSQERNPLVATDDARSVATDITADIRNNVVWNWGSGFGTRVQAAAWANAVNNLYASPGGGDDHRAALRVCTGSCPEDPPNATTAGRLYASGNFSGDSPGFIINEFGTEARPFATGPITTEDTCLVAHRVVAEAGVHPRDALDQQLVSAVALPSCPPVFVKSLYYEALGRLAGDVEVQSWLAAFGSSPAPLAVWSAIRTFFESEEVRAKPITPAGYVIALHRAALGRDPDSEALAFYTGEVLARFNTVLPGFTRSAEFAAVRAQTSPETLLFRIYRQALGRLPTEAEVQRGIQYLATTDDITPGLAFLLNSDDFVGVPRTLAQHVRVLYRALLGREPDAEGQAAWVDSLAAQLAILGGRASDAAEFETRIARLFGGQ